VPRALLPLSIDYTITARRVIEAAIRTGRSAMRVRATIRVICRQTVVPDDVAYFAASARMLPLNRAAQMRQPPALLPRKSCCVAVRTSHTDTQPSRRMRRPRVYAAYA